MDELEVTPDGKWDLSGVHESTTCTLGANGGPCEMCAQANRSVLNPTEQRILTAIRQDRQVASITVIRAAIADVLDAGRVDEDSRQRAWIFLHTEDDEESERREEFLNAVQRRITALQSPPHNMDARLLHLPVTGYGRGYADGWLDAHTETLKAQNEDLRELQQLTETKIKEL